MNHFYQKSPVSVVVTSSDKYIKFFFLKNSKNHFEGWKTCELKNEIRVTYINKKNTVL